MPVVAQRMTGLAEVNGHLIEQEFRVVIAAADRGPLDLQVLDEGLDVVGRQFGAEYEVKIDPRTGFEFLIDDDVVHPAFDDR